MYSLRAPAFHRLPTAGNPAQGQIIPRNYYDGWSCFNKQLVNQHGLARKWSNPAKVSLTEKVGGGRAVGVMRRRVEWHSL